MRVGYSTTGTATLFLDPSLNDDAWCPPRGMKMSAPDNNYFPVWGNQSSVFNDYGLVMVRQDGECSTPFPDTGLYWDFQVPCRAHDYCYDLIRIGLSGTVSKSSCDSIFHDFMRADCNDRNIVSKASCYGLANSVYLLVVDYGVVNVNPGIATIRNKNNGRCAEVEQGSAANSAPIQQWTCRNYQRERFKIYPASGHPGYFQLEPEHVQNKCARAITDPVQYDCANWGSMRFKLQPALNGDQYSIRLDLDESRCWKVPISYVNGVDLDAPTCNDYNTWYLWSIVRVT